ncbi:MAG: GNAT family N-acetyltransferase, partial [Pseudomonadota bacterium]|nr:GNAT family N-acetyltransferase [Pseudomonadota bacterium]
LRQPGATYALTLAGPGPETGTFVGCAGLTARDRGLELGYWIGEPYWKRGFATEAAHALVDLAFRATGIPVLYACARVINPASRRVIHKCGFQYAGQGMMNSILAGQVPVERYRLDRRTWESLRNWS